MRRPVAKAAVLVLFAAGAAPAAIAGTALIVYVPYAAVGAVLVIRRPGNSIGWLLTAIGWTFALAWLPVDATAGQLEGLSAPPLVLFTAWVQWWWSLPMALTLVTTLAIVFPSGRLPVGRWHRPALLLLSVMAITTTVAATWPLQVLETTLEGSTGMVRMPNPVGLVPADLVGPGTEWVATAIGPAMFVTLIVATGSLLVRYRRSSGMEHLQLRWLVAGLASVLVAIPIGFLLFALVGSAGGGLVWVPATVSFALPPIAIGIAVTRYRLYELDRLISRGLAWVVLSALLVVVYGAAILVLQGVMSGVTQGETVAVAASTLLAAALFQPLRVRVQRAMDHRFDRARYDGERTAVAFAERLRNEVDLIGLEADIRHTVQTALRPSSTGMWIRGAAEGSR